MPLLSRIPYAGSWEGTPPPSLDLTEGLDDPVYRQQVLGLIPSSEAMLGDIKASFDNPDREEAFRPLPLVEGMVGSNDNLAHLTLMITSLEMVTGDFSMARLWRSLQQFARPQLAMTEEATMLRRGMLDSFSTIANAPERQLDHYLDHPVRQQFVSAFEHFEDTFPGHDSKRFPVEALFDRGFFSLRGKDLHINNFSDLSTLVQSYEDQMPDIRINVDVAFIYFECLKAAEKEERLQMGLTRWRYKTPILFEDLDWTVESVLDTRVLSHITLPQGAIAEFSSALS